MVCIEHFFITGFCIPGHVCHVWYLLVSDSLIIFLLFVFVAVSTITDVLLLRRSHLRAMNNNGAYVAAHDTGPEDDVFAVAKVRM